jgi:hypothetical protein
MNSLIHLALRIQVQPGTSKTACRFLEGHSRVSVLCDLEATEVIRLVRRKKWAFDGLTK